MESTNKTEITPEDVTISSYEYESGKTIIHKLTEKLNTADLEDLLVTLLESDKVKPIVQKIINETVTS